MSNNTAEAQSNVLEATTHPQIKHGDRLKKNKWNYFRIRESPI
jgi:hypothetical protein